MSFGIVLAVCGGLSLFLYGMKMMSDGLEKVAGARLRGILAATTKNKFVAVLVGTLVTAIIQSSSATTVLVVSFVNAGLMTLTESVGIILGANIGTTITGQLIALNLTDMAPIFVLIGIIMIMMIKKTSVRKTGEIIFGFGLLFIGLGTMSGALEGVKSMPIIVDTLASLRNPVLAILIGFVVTAILQSCSASIGIVMVLAAQELIPVPISFYLILGCNIGATATAMLASLSAKRDAKRAALIHLLVNIIGAVVNAVILYFFMDEFIMLLDTITKNVSSVPVNGINDKIAKNIANANTILKVMQVLVVFPFTNLIVRFTDRLVRKEDTQQDGMHLEYISEHSVFSPQAAIPATTQEIIRMGNIAFDNLDRAMKCLLDRNVEGTEKVYETEKTINYLNTEITKYLVKANQLSLPVADRKSLAGLFHVVSDIERIGDHAENVADFTKQMVEDNFSFSEQGEEEIRDMYEKTRKLLGYALEMFSKKTEEHLHEILDIEENIDDLEKELQMHHVHRLTEGLCSAESGMVFSDLVSNLERVADHGTNIAFSILNRKDEMNRDEQVAIADRDE
ncbi:MAG: Na/Pi cotransporter family protein [Lachnospiraceae bacterium]|nr:Na/Pi cotransporter family protein [Lachnospiraceae bacterium]